VLLAAGLLFFSGLDAPLLEPQEARYAEIPRQMLVEGRFLVPFLHGQPYLDKPPLLYWSVMVSYRLFGVHDWAARLVPGLAGVLTVLAAWLWGRRVFGALPGLCGALLLCLSPGFLYRARMLTFDTLLALLVTVTLTSAHVALTSSRLRWRWWLVSAVACGLGLLTKGPVALALVAGPIVVLPFLDRRFTRLTLRAWAVYLAVAIGLAAPWYGMVIQAMPDFAADFFWKHNVLRFVAPFDHAGPVWYYLPGLFIGLLPWTLLVPGLVQLLIRRGARSTRRRPAALGFVLFSFGWMLLFFSAAGCKRPTYLLPALPPMALALGWYVSLRAPTWRALIHRASKLASVSAVLVLIAGFTIALTATLLGMLAPRAGLILAGLAVTAIAGLARRQGRISWAGSAGVAFVALQLAVLTLLPGYNRNFALRDELRRHTSFADSSRLPLVCYPQRFDSVSFYLPDRPVHTFGPHQQDELLTHLQAHPGTLLVVKSGQVLEELLRNLPPTVGFHAQARKGAITVAIIGRARHDRVKSSTVRLPASTNPPPCATSFSLARFP
jgi:4-amino-4-deoxy-L-arabinose transferase-like glycosyltransferase